MSNRHLARSVVLQTLFELDSAHFKGEKPIAVLTRNSNEFAPQSNDFPFMKNLLDIIVGQRKKIDEIITKAAPEWPLERIALTDRNILRIGLAELLFADRSTVPPKVAINEAIELAKEFGSDASSKFVNGVLGAVYTELGEPGKKDAPKKKKEVAYKDMIVEELVGAVVYAEYEGNIYLALVHDVFGRWTLSKGKLKEKESLEAGAKRKVLEEIGLKVTLQETLGENEYVASDPELGKKRRHATYFLAQASYEELSLKQEGGLDDAQWFRLADIGDLNFYDDVLPVITNAINILVKKSSTKK